MGKEAMDQLKNGGLGGLEDSLKKMKDDGKLDKLQEQLGGLGGGAGGDVFENMMNLLKGGGMGDLMSKLQSDETMSKMKSYMKDMGLNPGGGDEDEDSEL